MGPPMPELQPSNPDAHRLYICGPMSAMPDFNHPAFFEAEAALLAAGFRVINPVLNGLPKDAEWAHHMKRDIALLLGCTGVATLDGWQASRGAKLEVHIARELGIPVMRHAEWLMWSGR